MRKIIEFDGGDSAEELAAICKQTKTAAVWNAKDFQTEATQKTSKIFVLIDTGIQKNTLGFCSVRFVCETAEITNFAVLPSQQRKHFGSELFTHTLNFLKTQGIKNVTLEVSSANKPAQEFYKKFNFINVSMRKKFYNMKEDALILKLDL